VLDGEKSEGPKGVRMNSCELIEYDLNHEFEALNKIFKSERDQLAIGLQVDLFTAIVDFDSLRLLGLGDHEV
jgi:hypothetical protein